MAAYAGLQDVETRFAVIAGRSLTEPEKSLASILIAEASAMLRQQSPGIDDALANGSLDAGLVAGKVAAAVVRVLRNPEGLAEERFDDYGYVRGELSASGVLSFPADDLAQITGTAKMGGAFTGSVLPPVRTIPPDPWTTL